MGSYSDSTSDLDEELPVFDFLSQVSQSHTEKPEAAKFTAVKGSVGKRTADVLMISSDSDDGAPYVPLAQRLKQKQDNVITTSSAAANGKYAEPCFMSNLSSVHQLRTTTNRSSDGSEDSAALPPEPLSCTETSPAKRKPAKRSAEEMQASREEALRRRRQAREGQQKDKGALRQEQERQKAERRALAEAAKALRPEECIKHMVVAVDPALLQLEGGGTLLASVQALGCSCAIEKQPLPRSVSWMRRTPCVSNVDCIHERCTCVFSLQEERQGRSDSGPSLSSWVQEQQRRHPDKILSLVAKATSEYKTAVVHLQLHTGVSVRFLSTWKDFSDHITMTTKAVAEAPFKRERDKTGFSFCLESEWGLLQVWKRQIQQLNRVSPDMASAILAAYPSPRLLQKAYDLRKSDREKIALLSDLLIRRGEGVTSTTRRVGPELSKRLFLLMNSRDPEQTLDSTV
uniref:Essential meiotic structure-specific endonuclease 1 n=1 Tax=Labrus bergylta TaxID=56723 RepID=A0A3Q3H0L1_9LABR